jgi:hypothetical protein
MSDPQKPMPAVVEGAVEGLKRAEELLKKSWATAERTRELLAQSHKLLRKPE